MILLPDSLLNGINPCTALLHSFILCLREMMIRRQKEMLEKEIEEKMNAGLAAAESRY